MFLPAFSPGATPRHETMRVECRAVLAGAYIQCDLALTRADGRERGVMWLWNFNEVSGEYEGMSLASNYGQESTFQIRWDAVEEGYVGYLPTRTADGRAATERLIFRVSADRNSFQGHEVIRPNDNPDGSWVQTFEYVLRRTD